MQVFFVASVFGLVTLLTIVQQANWDELPILLSLFPYVGFSYLGFWSLRRFRVYASDADMLRRELAKYIEDVEFDTAKGKMKHQTVLSEGVDRDKQRYFPAFIFKILTWVYIAVVPGILSGIIYAEKSLVFFVVFFVVLLILICLSRTCTMNG